MHEHTRITRVCVCTWLPSGEWNLSRLDQSERYLDNNMIVYLNMLLHFIAFPTIDINECEVSNGGCEQICTNTIGSRVCSCRSGFRPAGTTCQGWSLHGC